MTEDSPYQDAKDAGHAIKESASQLGQAARKLDDFAGHSTGRIIGPAVTKIRGWIKAGADFLYKRWTTPGPFEREDMNHGFKEYQDEPETKAPEPTETYDV